MIIIWSVLQRLNGEPPYVTDSRRSAQRLAVAQPMPTVRNVSAGRSASRATRDTLLWPVAQAAVLAVSVDCVQRRLGALALPARRRYFGFCKNWNGRMFDTGTVHMFYKQNHRLLPKEKKQTRQKPNWIRQKVEVEVEEGEVQKIEEKRKRENRTNTLSQWWMQREDQIRWVAHINNKREKESTERKLWRGIREWGLNKWYKVYQFQYENEHNKIMLQKNKNC